MSMYVLLIHIPLKILSTGNKNKRRNRLASQVAKKFTGFGKSCKIFQDKATDVMHILNKIKMIKRS